MLLGLGGGDRHSGGQRTRHLRLVGLRGAGIPSGLHRQVRPVADLHLLRRRGRGVREDPLGLQDRSRASLLAERGEVARGGSAGAARHIEDRGLEGPQSRHHEDEGPGDHGRRHRLVHALGLGQHAADLQLGEGLRRRHQVAEVAGRSEVQGSRLDRRQRRRRLCARRAGDRA